MENEIARKWYKQACHDLEMAEKNIGIGGYDIACFLSHQAVEKALKALFALAGRGVPRSHHIDEMAHELDLSFAVIDQLIDLSGEYMLTRYPDVAEKTPYEEYTREMAEEKTGIARSVFTALRSRFAPLEEN